MQHARAIKTNVSQATHVRIGGQVEKIRSKWGIDAEGRLAKPSAGGFGVVTEGGRTVTMWEAEEYIQVAELPVHEYRSTACTHNLHCDCRKSCTYCGAECVCSCHRKD